MRTIKQWSACCMLQPIAMRLFIWSFRPIHSISINLNSVRPIAYEYGYPWASVSTRSSVPPLRTRCISDVLWQLAEWIRNLWTTSSAIGLNSARIKSRLPMCCGKARLAETRFLSSYHQNQTIGCGHYSCGHTLSKSRFGGCPVKN
jgi:hypothetical protein